MDWKYFPAISAYILMVCDLTLGATMITNVTLVDGQTPNEGRVEYITSEATTWQSACGNGIGYEEASVICRQLGYPGVNNYILHWSFGMHVSIAQKILSCAGDEDNLAGCSLLTSICSNLGGVICYDHSYQGCFHYAEKALDDLEAPCEDNFPGLTILKCVSLCYHTSNAYTSAGMYKGNICLCGNASATNNQSKNRDDKHCSSKCAGREIEKCGGPSHIAIVNITLFLQNNNVAPSPIGCEELTPTPTEGDLSTTTASNVSSSSPSRSSPSSTSHTVTAGTSSMTAVQNTRGMTSDMGSRSQTPTGMPQRTTKERTMGMRGNLGLYIGVGAGGGVLVLILLILMIVFIIRWRRSKDKKSSKDHTMLELRSRPDGSDLDVYPYPPASSNNYSLGNGQTNPMGVNNVMEDSDYSVIADTSMNPVNSARTSSAYEHVPRLDSTSDSRRPLKPASRISVNEDQYSMHPDTSELYTKPDTGQRENSFSEYTVSQKVSKEPIGQRVPEVPPSPLNPEDIAGLYTMPDKSKKATKPLERNMGSDGGIDNALYICRGDEEAEGPNESSEYATDKIEVEVSDEERGDDDAQMVENELYETSDRPDIDFKNII